jgi:transmembrane protein 216
MATLKFINLEYDDTIMYTESLILLAILVLESVRIHLGRKGSLSDHGKF